MVFTEIRRDGVETSWGALSMLLHTVLTSAQTSESANEIPLVRGMYTDESTFELFSAIFTLFPRASSPNVNPRYQIIILDPKLLTALTNTLVSQPKANPPETEM